MFRVAKKDNLENGGGKLLRKVGVCIPKYITPNSRKVKSL